MICGLSLILQESTNEDVFSMQKIFKHLNRNVRQATVNEKGNLVQYVLVYYNSILFLLLIIHSVNHERLRSMLTTWKRHRKPQ